MKKSPSKNGTESEMPFELAGYDDDLEWSDFNDNTVPDLNENAWTRSTNCPQIGQTRIIKVRVSRPYIQVQIIDYTIGS